jgi:hypothetical protein
MEVLYRIFIEFGISTILFMFIVIKLNLQARV